MRERSVVLEEIAAAAREVRAKQAQYFRTRASEALFESKRVERKLDGLLAELDSLGPRVGA